MARDRSQWGRWAQKIGPGFIKWFLDSPASGWLFLLRGKENTMCTKQSKYSSVLKSYLLFSTAFTLFPLHLIPKYLYITGTTVVLYKLYAVGGGGGGGGGILWNFVWLDRIHVSCLHSPNCCKLPGNFFEAQIFGLCSLSYIFFVFGGFRLCRA